MKPICPFIGSVLIYTVINNCVYTYILSEQLSPRGPICNVNEYMCPDETCIPVEYGVMECSSIARVGKMN